MTEVFWPNRISSVPLLLKDNRTRAIEWARVDKCSVAGCFLSFSRSFFISFSLFFFSTLSHSRHAYDRCTCAKKQKISSIIVNNENNNQNNQTYDIQVTNDKSAPNVKGNRRSRKTHASKLLKMHEIVIKARTMQQQQQKRHREREREKKRGRERNETQNFVSENAIGLLYRWCVCDSDIAYFSSLS